MQPRPTILFVHQNFPAQFLHLATALAEADRHHIAAIGSHSARVHPRIRFLTYPAPEGPGGTSPPACHPWVVDAQTKALRAEAVLRLLLAQRRQGFRPDLIVGHTGWGELLAVRHLFGDIPILGYQEFLYHLHGADLNFDPEFGINDPFEAGRLAFKTSTQLQDLHAIDWGLTPTWWQWSVFPEPWRSKISVIHEGIDCQRIAPTAGASFRIRRAGILLKPGDEVVTYIGRNLEPYRGFHTFLRMLPDLQRLRPSARVVIIGGNDVSYGQRPGRGFATWKEYMLHEVAGVLDPERIHFIGRVPSGTLHDVLRVSACHVYLTVPFVLSWSLLEAMACGALVVASSTPPVQEVIRDGVNGRLVDFLDPTALAHTVADVLAHPARHRRLREAARRTVQERYDLHGVCLPRQLALLQDLVEHRRPALHSPPEGLRSLLFRHPRRLQPSEPASSRRSRGFG